MGKIVPIYLAISLHQYTRRSWILHLQYSWSSCESLTGVDAYEARHPPQSQLQPDDKKKTLVVLGTGWGCTSLLKGLNTEDYNVIVVSPRNYFLFTRIISNLLKILTDSIITFYDYRFSRISIYYATYPSYPSIQENRCSILWSWMYCHWSSQ
jgi:hypothetical protein